MTELSCGTRRRRRGYRAVAAVAGGAVRGAPPRREEREALISAVAQVTVDGLEAAGGKQVVQGRQARGWRVGAAACPRYEQVLDSERLRMLIATAASYIRELPALEDAVQATHGGARVAAVVLGLDSAQQVEDAAGLGWEGAHARVKKVDVRPEPPLPHAGPPATSLKEDPGSSATSNARKRERCP